MARKARAKCGLEEVSNHYRIRVPKQLTAGKQKYLSTGLEISALGKEKALAIIAQIESDAIKGVFDETLAKYNPKRAEQLLKAYTLADLLDLYAGYKDSIWKPKTRDNNLQRIEVLKNLPSNYWQKPLLTRQWLLDRYTSYYACTILKVLNAALTWSLDNKLISEKPSYSQIIKELESKRLKAEPHPLSSKEIHDLLMYFKDEPWAHNYVKFLLLTGCRPNEACGLHWHQIKEDNSEINFCQTLYRDGEYFEIVQGTKTVDSRIFPCNPALAEFLKMLRLHRKRDVVLTNAEGKYINHESFRKTHWNKARVAIGLPSLTPYALRDTFITNQIKQGINTSIVARWVGNSGEVIESHYLGNRTLGDVKPL